MSNATVPDIPREAQLNEAADLLDGAAVLGDEMEASKPDRHDAGHPRALEQFSPLRPWQVIAALMPVTDTHHPVTLDCLILPHLGQPGM
mmetsp:Transcript_5587/g.16568  ORF Transcript_5587/g.16568 Transcript_5587/m.16568 type:complete len:89 (+) Transcript_5587:1784-2050(+)